MNLLYKELFIEKIRTNICYVTYKSLGKSFEKPFRFVNIGDGQSFLNLIDCISELPFKLYLDDVLMFYIEHEDNQKEAEIALQQVKTQFNEFAKTLTFIRENKLQDLFFRSDLEENKKTRIKNIKILDALRLDELNDYERLIANDPKMVEMLKSLWILLITERFDATIKSINEEIKEASEEIIAEELKSIKDVLSVIPSEIELELKTKNSYSEIIEYWPSLLLPKSNIFNIS